LNGEKYLLRGEIHVDSSSYPKANELTRSIIVDIWENKGAFLDMINNFKLVSSANGPSNIVVYKYTHWANLEDEMVFVLRDKRNASVKNSFEKALFYPRSQYVVVKTDGFQPDTPSFLGCLRKYI